MAHEQLAAGAFELQQANACGSALSATALPVLYIILGRSQSPKCSQTYQLTNFVLIGGLVFGRLLQDTVRGFLVLKQKLGNSTAKAAVEVRRGTAKSTALYGAARRVL